MVNIIMVSTNPREEHNNLVIPLEWSQLELTCYRKQVKQIKELTAHYTNYIDEKASRIEGGAIDERMNDQCTENLSLPSRTPPCESGVHCFNSYCTFIADKESGLNDGKTEGEFTLGKTDKRCISVIKGDNQGSNWHKGDMDTSPVLKPKALDAVISIIDMPSQAQGQVFRNQSSCTQHNRNSTRPVSSHRPVTAYSERQEQKVTGWKRDVRSATMYTRYRTPELFSLIYSNLKSETTSSSLSTIISPVHGDPLKTNTKYRLATLIKKCVCIYKGVST